MLFQRTKSIPSSSEAPTSNAEHFYFTVLIITSSEWIIRKRCNIIHAHFKVWRNVARVQHWNMYTERERESKQYTVCVRILIGSIKILTMLALAILDFVVWHDNCLFAENMFYLTIISTNLTFSDYATVHYTLVSWLIYRCEGWQ